jgi:hypothetical protein
MDTCVEIQDWLDLVNQVQGTSVKLSWDAIAIVAAVVMLTRQLNCLREELSDGN